MFRRRCFLIEKKKSCNRSVTGLLVRVLRFELRACRLRPASRRLILCTWRRDEALSSRQYRYKKRTALFRELFFGPSAEIRTQGLLNPIQARYQTSPHPEITARCSGQLRYSTTHKAFWQEVFQKFFAKFFILPLWANEPLPPPADGPRTGRTGGPAYST